MPGAGEGQQGAPGPGRPDTKPAGGRDTVAVVVGLDGSATSWDAFWWACGEARRLGGQVVAVFVSSSADACLAMASAVAGVAVCDYTAVDQAAADHAARLLAQVRSHGDADGPDVVFVYARGDPGRELLRVAREARADLIVVGRSMKARHRLAGSLGRNLVLNRTAPVVVVVP